MSVDHELMIAFPKCSSGEANQLAVELRDLLIHTATVRGVSSAMRARVEKEDAEHQDFGATLAILMGTPAAIAIAKGVHDFIAARGHTVVIKTKDGSIIATGGAANNIDISKTVRALEGS
jgi:hypothetical protein